MSLDASPILFIFYEISLLPRQRTFMEDVLELPVIENQFHPPHHHHGLVKYDAGPMILALNLWAPAKFQRVDSDGLVTVLATQRKPEIISRLKAHGYQLDEARGVLTDEDGHHYVIADASSAEGASFEAPLAVRELSLTVRDLAASLPFYRDILGLEVLDRTADTARFATGNVDLVLQQGTHAVDGRQVRTNTYLIVFYTPDIEAMFEVLIRRGLQFKSRAAFGQIGGTARFVDPSGHTYCLYEPSAESLTWDSGAKVKALTGAINAFEPALVGGS